MNSALPAPTLREYCMPAPSWPTGTVPFSPVHSCLKRTHAAELGKRRCSRATYIGVRMLKQRPRGAEQGERSDQMHGTWGVPVEMGAAGPGKVHGY